MTARPGEPTTRLESARVGARLGERLLCQLMSSQREPGGGGFEPESDRLFSRAGRDPPTCGSSMLVASLTLI